MLPGSGFSIASCSAYITMKGVMMPGVSAGSNQVGASDICTPHVSWRCGAAAPSRGRLAAATPSAAPAIAPRRPMRVARGKWRVSPRMDEAMVLLLAAPLMELAHSLDRLEVGVSYLL